MKTRWNRVLAGMVLALGVVTCMSSGAAGRAAADDVPPEEWVAVQLAQPFALQSGPGPLSLEARGFRLMAVPPGRAAADYARELASLPGVLSAEADIPVVAAGTVPSDPLYEGFQSQYLGPIGAERAWDVATGNGAVTIAVIDSGLDVLHPEFAGRLWVNAGEVPGNGIDDDSNGCVDDLNGCRFLNVTPERALACGYTSSLPTGDVLDDHGKPGATHHSHGTIVGGIAAAGGDNAAGVAGVAWNARIMVIKVLDCGVPSRGGLAAGDLSNVAQGIDYARRMGADLINLSLSTTDGSPDLAILREAVATANAAGIPMVAAAGNHLPGSAQVGPGYPAAYTEFANVIAVGASDNLNGNTWASFSNYGPALDLAAPGVAIASTARISNFAPASGFVVTDGGTSYSTPIVSGLLALMMGRNSALGADRLINLVRATATPPVPAPHGGNWAGAGVVDLGRALAAVPMRIEGVALHDWMDVPPGTDVRARVGAAQCGATQAAAGATSSFALEVASAATVPGCGQPGSTVEILIGGIVAEPTLVWGGRDADLATVGVEPTSVTPPPGLLVLQALGGGWSNVAQLDAGGAPEVALSDLPATWEEALWWDPLAEGFLGPGRYLRHTRGAPDYANDLALIERYAALWVSTPGAATAASLNPNPAPGRAVLLEPGWNNFVYTGTTRQVEAALAAVHGRYTVVAAFDNVLGQWGVYVPGLPRQLNDFGGLLRLRVYWVYMSEAAELVMY